MKKIAVVLSGCGVFDGAEIHESVITLLALSRAGAEVVHAAPNIPQRKVVNHFRNEESSEIRNVLVESARIARGEIIDLANLKASDIDGIIFPGGFGAALNLSDFALRGADGVSIPDVHRIIKEMMLAKKPIGVMCIAPGMLANALKDIQNSVKLTIGTDEGTATAIESSGQIHVACDAKGFVVDDAHKVVSTPAYMNAGSLAELEVGITKLVDAVLEMCA